MNPLDNYIQEALLGRKNHADALEGELQLATLKKYSYDKMWAQYKHVCPWETGSVNLGPKGIEIYCIDEYGYMLIGKIHQKHSPKFGISNVEGEIHIYENEIESCDGMFTPDCEYEGNLYIYDNNFLKSLSGIPKKIDGKFYCRNNSINTVHDQKELETLINSLPQCKYINIDITRSQEDNSKLKYRSDKIEEEIRKVTKALTVNLVMRIFTR